MAAESGLVLYDYWRSTAAYRVRIALNIKGLAYEQRVVDLVADGGRQHADEYRALNPQGLVPALVHGGTVLTQSLAICEYLEELFPEPAILPRDAEGRASVRSMAQVIASDVHPINNLRIQQYLKREIGASEAQVVAWMIHWMTLGFAALESRLGGGDYCHGDTPGLADIALVGQAYNADRFGCDMAPFPKVLRVINHCRKLDAFMKAAPENQPGALAV